MELIKPLTAGEENLMKLLWKLKPVYLKDIMNVHPEPKPHQNTISTFLKNLVEKGFLKTTLEGRIFIYEVAISKNDYKNFLLKNFINGYYNGSTNDLLLDLMNDNKVILEKSIKKKKKKKKK